MLFGFDLSFLATADLPDVYAKISAPPCVAVPSERAYWRGALEKSQGRHLLTTLKFPGDGDYTVWASLFAIDAKVPYGWADVRAFRLGSEATD